MTYIEAGGRQCIAKHSILRITLNHFRNRLTDHVRSASSRIADLHIINRNILYITRFHTGYGTGYQAFCSSYNVADIYILQYTTFFPVSAVSVSQTDKYIGVWTSRIEILETVIPSIIPPSTISIATPEITVTSAEICSSCLLQ